MMVSEAAPSLIDRTFANLRALWHEVSARFETPLSDLPEDAVTADRLRQAMRACLEARGGEVSARARAAELGHTYLRLPPPGRRLFLSLLATEFDVDRAQLAKAIEAWTRASGLPEQVPIEEKLRDGLTAPRVRLLTQFNALPQGVKFLVDLRADLIRELGEDPALAGLDRDMRQLLASWFDVGFLDLRSITWDSAASLLEKLIAYEAVHKIQSWADLRNRLDSDRRCYAYFHPRMPDEPLIFVQVALLQGVAANIQDLLDERAPAGNPREADTAIFYSITNAQSGLRGIAFGDFLIKKVVDALARDFPKLETFATLSPIPGFRRWLDRLELAELWPLIGPRLAERFAGEDPRRILAEPSWTEDPEKHERLREPLSALCAYYLLFAKERSRPLDPVARFHLGNGASVDRINWMGDRSAKGLKESAGLMVNYRYRLSDIEDNHEAYAAHGTIAASDAVRGMLRAKESDRRDRFSLFGRH